MFHWYYRDFRAKLSLFIWGRGLDRIDWSDFSLRQRFGRKCKILWQILRQVFTARYHILLLLNIIFSSLSFNSIICNPKCRSYIIFKTAGLECLECLMSRSALLLFYCTMPNKIPCNNPTMS